jgi:hypothetical protein
VNEGFLDSKKETIHRNKDPINKRSMKKDCLKVSHQAEGVSQDTLLLLPQRRQVRLWIFPRADPLAKPEGIRTAFTVGNLLKDSRGGGPVGSRWEPALDVPYPGSPPSLKN